MSHRQNEEPAAFDAVLAAERKALGLPEDAGPRPGGPAPAVPKAKAAKDPAALRPFGLALSGGGIRSATFCLGVIQGLANKGQLANFDYLSTVSGGGYIGAWLSAWIHRSGLAAVCAALKKTGSVDASPPESTEPSQVTWLRRYSNYLAPQLGLLSTDTLTLATTWLRNVFLNLIILFSALAAAFLVPRLAMLVSSRLVDFPGAFGYAAAWTGIIFVFGIALNLHAQFRRARREPGDNRSSVLSHWFNSSRGVTLTVLAPGCLAAICASIWLFGTKEFNPEKDTFGALGIVTALLLVTGVVFIVLGLRARVLPLTDLLASFGIYLLAGAISLAAGAGLLVAVRSHTHSLAAVESLPLLLTLGPSVHLVVFGIVGSLFTGLTGRVYHESSREWWSRLNAYLLMLGLIWLILAGASFYALPLLEWAVEQAPGWATAIAGSAWIGSLLAALFVSRPKTATLPLQLNVESVLNAAATFFSVGLLILAAAATAAAMSSAADWATVVPLKAEANTQSAKPKPNESVQPGEDKAEKKPPQSLPEFVKRGMAELERERTTCLALHFAAGWHWLPERVKWTNDCGKGRQQAELAGSRIETNIAWLAFFLMLIVLAVFSWRVDINKFSLHNMYRNRLVRCYLGASNRRRAAQAFTGFDRFDDFALSALAEDKRGGVTGRAQRPYHIFNTAMNLSQGKNLAWQERKAASFSLAPLFCGFELGRSQGDTDRYTRKAKTEGRRGYRDTTYYAMGSERDKARDYEDRGVTVGTAMATSGAAASPNMGYATHPARAFLLTVFNVRLGVWGANPATPYWQAARPQVGAYWLLSELFGYSNERSDFVYLSDGGHFDNLGLYELVRRRASFIIAVDATADPRRMFGDLGRSVRAVRVDFGVEIELPGDASLLAQQGFALGTIHYAPDSRDGAPKGTLLYIKPSLESAYGLPKDIAAYSQVNPLFPHQTTADQFFDESQFESYRKLGFLICVRALERYRECLPDPVHPATDADAPQEEKARVPYGLGRWFKWFATASLILFLLLWLTEDWLLGSAASRIACLKEAFWLVRDSHECARGASLFVLLKDTLSPKVWLLFDNLFVLGYTATFLLGTFWALGYNLPKPLYGRKLRWSALGVTIVAVLSGLVYDYGENFLLFSGLTADDTQEDVNIATQAARFSGAAIRAFAASVFLVGGLALVRCVLVYRHRK